jgi:hypothetical protein
MCIVVGVWPTDTGCREESRLSSRELAPCRQRASYFPLDGDGSLVTLRESSFRHLERGTSNR